MSAGGDGPPSPEPVRRKFRRMTSPATAAVEMGAVGAFGTLKAEVDTIYRSGIAHLLGDEKERLSPLLHPYLSGTASNAYVDTTGAQYEEDTNLIYKAVQEKYGVDFMSSNTGTKCVQLDKDASLNTYVKLIENLKLGPLDSDNVPTFFLDFAGGAQAPKKKSGGFKDLYPTVNVPVQRQNKMDQDRCIFGVKPSDISKLCGTKGGLLLEDATKAVKSIYKTNVHAKVVHLLFHWNSHSFFSYHKDSDGEITVMINLGPGDATMHVAGKEEAQYLGIGAAQIFPGQVSHRSGTAPRRCVKMAIFYSIEGHMVAEEAEAPAAPGASNSADDPAEIIKPKTEA